MWNGHWWRADPGFPVDFGRVVTREYLSLTVDLDHDIVDGAPAARFVQHVKELIERGNGLIDASEERGDRAEPDAASATFETPSKGATVWSTGREGQAHAPEGSPHGAGF